MARDRSPDRTEIQKEIIGRKLGLQA